MEVITIDSKAFKELQAKIDSIANYILDRQELEEGNEDNIWVDSYEVCTFLKISERTLQRLRSKNEITFSTIRGRHYYKIGEIKSMLENHLIKSSQESIQDLITNHKLHAQQRRTIKTDK
jgi:hypothetical protein